MQQALDKDLDALNVQTRYVVLGGLVRPGSHMRFFFDVFGCTIQLISTFSRFEPRIQECRSKTRLTKPSKACQVGWQNQPGQCAVARSSRRRARGPNLETCECRGGAYGLTGPIGLVNMRNVLRGQGQLHDT